jgi:hypothetical protein
MEHSSEKKKNDENVPSCAMHNDAVSRHFPSDGYFNPKTKACIHSLITF